MCDRHFQKVKLWSQHFEHREILATAADVKNAIERGARASNKSRVILGKEVIRCFVLIVQIEEPSRLKSTHGVTWHRTNTTPDIDPDFPVPILSGKIINHIYPDVDDRSHGDEVSHELFECEEYPENFVGRGYKDWSYKPPTANYIKGQVNRRIKWTKTFGGQSS